MKLDFYYWASMCPLNDEMICLLKEYEKRMEISIHDISGNPRLAEKMHMYYPTLTVINDSYRFFNPLKKTFLDQLCEGMIPEERPYQPKQGEVEYCGSIIPITKENYILASHCTASECTCGCRNKLSYVEDKIDVLGYMNIEEEQLLGGVEYMPSIFVPYCVPHDEQTAFITCVYLTNGEFDYKSAPLRKLEKYLAEKYRRVVVISDEVGTFPNGDMTFFIKNGYIDMGVVAIEKDYCKLHMMCKELL